MIAGSSARLNAARMVSSQFSIDALLRLSRRGGRLTLTMSSLCHHSPARSVQLHCGRRRGTGVVTRIVRAQATNGALVDPRLAEILQHVALGVLNPEDAAVQLNQLVAGAPNVTNVEAASLAKAEFPEVVWGEGKSAQHIAATLQRVAERQGMAAATRVDADIAAEVTHLLPDVQFNSVAKMLTYRSPTTKQEKLPGTVALITAGTADPRVVEECRLMLQAMGCYSFKLAESGVMGMHRLVQNLDAVRAADVVLVITGYDGGIASVVAGLVEAPVVCLPTSTGYGTAFHGVAPMLAALNSSAPGVVVVNIDSGFGASMAAWRILKNVGKLRKAIASQK